jgi:hypothetical protein
MANEDIKTVFFGDISNIRRGIKAATMRPLYRHKAPRQVQNPSFPGHQAEIDQLQGWFQG